MPGFPGLTFRLRLGEVEQLTLNQRVPGSSLVRPPSKLKELSEIFRFCGTFKEIACTRWSFKSFRCSNFASQQKSTTVPSNTDWLQLRVDHDGDRVRLITRGGCDWPTALKSKATSRSLLPVRGHLDPLGDVDS